MSLLFPLLGWLIAAACVATGAASLARAVPLGKGRRLRPGRKGARPGTVLLLWSCLSVACLTGLGVIGLWAGIIASVVLAVTTIVALRRSPGARRAHLAAGPVHLGHDIALLASRARHAARERAASGGPAPDAAPAPATAGGAPVRTPTPLLREDTALGPVPAPEEVITGVVVPAPWAELAGVIAGFIPEDDVAQSGFLAGTAAGLVAVAQAFGAHSDSLVNEVGVDPAYGTAILEFGERIGECAADVALADRRYHVIYGEVKAWLEGGGILPHRPRDWFGGGGGPAPAGGSEAA